MVAASRPRKLRRVIIREEYVALTGNYVRAVLLHQFEYRQKCAFDVDYYLAEEGARLAQEGTRANLHPANGWFYKKAVELAGETMLGLDETTIRRHLRYFVERGWVDERRNPQKRWDRTMQYRLNLVQLKADLEAVGYQLQEWVLNEPVNPVASTTGKMQLRSGNMPDRSGDLPLRSCDSQDRSGEIQEQYQNTSLEHRAEHINNTAESQEGCVSKSKYSPEEIRRYVEDCEKQGQRIRGGLAIWLEETGKGDHLIATFQERVKEGLPDNNKQTVLHTHECPRCFGSQNGGCTWSRRKTLH